MKRTKAQRGITLIALIITIVVLLILAVVAIREVRGEGIIAKAKAASEQHEIAQEKEEIQIALNEWKIQKNLPDSGTFFDFMQQKLVGASVVAEGNNLKITMKSGREYTVTEDGTITLQGTTSGEETPPEPGTGEGTETPPEAQGAGLLAPDGTFTSWDELVSSGKIQMSGTEITGRDWGYNLEGSLVIDNSVTSIGGWALSFCSDLTSITIGSGLKSIGEGAFSGWSSLTSIVVSSDNSVYDSRNNCNAIIEKSTNALINGCSTTVIPEDVTSIRDRAFSGCSSLTNITIPDSVTSIECGAFDGCSSLTSITIPNRVTSIGDMAFNGCSSLTSITIPNSVTNIGEYPFACCTGLTSIVVSDGNSVYDSRNNCNAIIEKSTNTLIAGCSNTVLPNDVRRIGKGAFSGCSSLTNITIPDSVTSIGGWAFDGCRGLTSITIPNSVTSIEEYAFMYCESLTNITIPERVTIISDWTFFGCSGLTSITIGSNVTSIGENAFGGCSNLTSITIPESVTSIGEGVFNDCANLTSITWNGTTYSSVDDFLAQFNAQ